MFVCCVHNTGKSSLKKLRNKILQNFERKKEIVDLNVLLTLPLCGANVEYNIMRAEYIALIFRNSNEV